MMSDVIMWYFLVGFLWVSLVIGIQLVKDPDTDLADISPSGSAIVVFFWLPMVIGVVVGHVLRKIKQRT